MNIRVSNDVARSDTHNKFKKSKYPQIIQTKLFLNM
jgi:hypothetical protein